MSRILFIGLGEEEVQGYRYISNLLKNDGHECRVVTWLPRLSGVGVEALHAAAIKPGGYKGAEKIAYEIGFAHPSLAAAYDRDWYFASTSRRNHHALSVIAAGEQLINDWRPEWLVSAVGGETLRVVFSALADHHKIPAAYFNAIPLANRFVLLPSMSSPFIPAREDREENGYRPVNRGSSAENSRGGEIPSFVNYTSDSRLEPLIRAWEILYSNRGIYPASWLLRKSLTDLKNSLLSRVGAKTGSPDSEEVNILYPMHDERDFQVAVRERHAIPQTVLVKYLSTMLPPGYRLWVKPHPHHLSSHHQLVLKDLVDIPNISFLAPETGFAEAIEQCDVVFTLASTLGFEAVMRGKPVVCYGTPFYSGFGVTSDVGDPRQIARAIVASVGTGPSVEGVEMLTKRMDEFSWPGLFTPIKLTSSNLKLLARGLSDVIDTR